MLFSSSRSLRLEFYLEAHMNIENQPQAMTIAGLELRTSNDVANQTIPTHWQQFMNQAILEKIPNRLSNDIYAVYTNYEHESGNNTGTYSLVIGAAVASKSRAVLFKATRGLNSSNANLSFSLRIGCSFCLHSSSSCV